MGSEPLRVARLVQLNALVEAARRAFASKERARQAEASDSVDVEVEIATEAVESEGMVWTGVDGVFLKQRKLQHLQTRSQTMV